MGFVVRMGLGEIGVASFSMCFGWSFSVGSDGIGELEA
jgi:hypothetical protein